ncbi:stalk domain-containing protein [Paenibacillus sp. NPDC057967]|uniref:stalk domain-containing protein n=1 Tax=Paenibacillus sp. NPDC057967 TaxID=3346293 RepID=UPI0036DAEA0A
MKRVRDILTGAVIGALLMVGTTAGYAAVKQYVLTEASYPIFVNGTKYEDKQKPILNYGGSTYVPLANLGDLTGVNYQWNEAKKRVEIVVSGVNTQKKVYGEYTKDVPNFASVVGISDGKRIEASDKSHVLYKYDVTDATDGNLTKYVTALEKAGYVYEADTSTGKIVYYSKGKTVVGLWIEGYDFYVLLTSD